MTLTVPSIEANVPQVAIPPVVITQTVKVDIISCETCHKPTEYDTLGCGCSMTQCDSCSGVKHENICTTCWGYSCDAHYNTDDMICIPCLYDVDE